MKKLRLLIWILFISSLIFLRARSWYANSIDKPYDIVQLELASADSGKPLLEQWDKTIIDGGTLIDYARVDTYVDFLFIVGYIGVLLIVSYHLYRREKRSWLGKLLQYCVVAALVAGLLDVVENSILLLDMHRYSTSKIFYSSRYVAYPKFVLLLLVLGVWALSLLSRIGGRVNPKRVI